MNNFKVDKLGYYRTRAGELAHVFTLQRNTITTWPIQGTVDGIDDVELSWTVDGFFSENILEPSEYDLVEFVGEALPGFETHHGEHVTSEPQVQTIPRDSDASASFQKRGFEGLREWERTTLEKIHDRLLAIEDRLQGLENTLITLAISEEACRKVNG